MAEERALGWSKLSLFHQNTSARFYFKFQSISKMEKNPWYRNVQGPYLQWKGPVGIKEDGGGCTRAQGKVGNMVIHRAAFNRNKDGKL